jgi:photosystem II stability/assembly factor-like uncharacterized protein
MPRILVCLLAFLSLSLVSCGQEIHWESVSQIKSITIRASGHGWLVTATGDLLRTEDGGKNWDRTPAKAIAGFQSAGMLDDQSGLAVNNRGQIWNTIDGGKTWTAKAELQADAWHFNGSNQIQFVDEWHGWIIEALSIWHTDDGGKTWQRVFSPLQQKAKGQPVRGFFLNADTGWVSGTNGEVYITKDGGKTWLIQRLSGSDATFTDVFFVDENTGWLAGYYPGQYDNLLYYTTNGGKTWQSLQSMVKDASLHSIYFFNQKEGWACGEARSNRSNENSASGILMRTADGGQTWQSVFTSADDAFFERIWFIDGQRGWLFGRDNIYQTQDSGKTWDTTLKLPPIKK